MADLLSKLDFGQLKAATSKSKHILCLAGAGSGKTRVLTSRVFNLVKNNIKPENILAITFTRNSAKEMRERLQKMGVDSKKIWCQTFHAAAFKILRENYKSVKKIRIITDKNQDQLFKLCIAKLCLNKKFALCYQDYLKENNWPEYLFFEQITKVIKECKSRSLTLVDVIKRAKLISDDDAKNFYRLLYLIFKFYQKYLFLNNYFDFEDLMNKAIELLSQDNLILQHYQNKFQHILVDEFQDVNFTQVRFLNLLNNKDNNLFVVGDDWQAIYGWRGGNIGYILDFQRKYRDCEKIILPFNYRSDGYIVNAASKVIRKNKRQYKKKIKSFWPHKNKIFIFKAKDKKEELNFVLKRIKILLKRYKQEQIMLLGRNWKVLASYIDKLKRTKVLITTIHSAKGMEREVVFIIGLHSGRHGFPYIKEDYEIMKVIRDSNMNERLCEERRCFYVGITRAKKILYLCTIKNRESKFVEEIPKRFLKILNKKITVETVRIKGQNR
ncbi:MAG: ATP-dependent helicase [Patescibacteria group bacterium]|nr:ATP-dependent helicase [Patescibacteria group bacterium]